MPGRSEAARGFARAWLALLLAIGLLCGHARAQDKTDAAAQARQWDQLASYAEKQVADENTPSEALEGLRERLVAQRSEAIGVEQEAQPAVDELKQRIDAIGPPPAEGAQEAPEIATLRRQLQEQLATAQGPVLAAQEIHRRTDSVINAIDRTVRARFSAELMSRGPSPLQPSTWLGAVDELVTKVAAYRAALLHEFAEPGARGGALGRVPFNLLLMIGGLAVAFKVRAWLIEWIELRLGQNPGRRMTAWFVALRNLTRLVVPAVGAGLFFAAFDPAGLVARADEGRFFSLPPFALILIASGWVAGSLLAPKHQAYRLVPLDDREATQATVVVMLLGLVVSLSYLFGGLAVRWDLSTSTQSALQYPLVVLGAFGLWFMSKIIEAGRRRIAVAAASDRQDSATALIGRRFLQILVRLLRVVAVLAPLLGAAGYLPAAAFLVFRSIMTLGLLGAVYVVFDLLNKTLQMLMVDPRTPAREDDGGLIPVAVAALVGIAALPLLAMTWGARPSDIADFWTMMRDGVTLGGIRLSATAVVMLIFVFAIGFGLTRLLQTVLRGTVLPRTRLDAGGRNAVLAGVGYVGFAMAALAAVAAAGLNLSSLAIVAGALSVGIGFGMQNVVSNFVSGIILLVERPVKEGDWIEVGGFSGYVKGINVRSTEIQTFDRASVILPNSDLVAGTVLNRTHTGMSGRLQVPVGVTYDADPRKVEALLLEIAELHPLVLMDPAPRVLFLELGPDSMNFELRCWLRDVNFTLSARSDMNFEIVQRFAQAGLRVQFYGRDLPAPPPGEPAAPEEPEAVALLRGKQERGAI